MIDVAFTIDIVLNFFTAYYTNDYELIDDRKVLNYLTHSIDNL